MTKRPGMTGAVALLGVLLVLPAAPARAATVTGHWNVTITTPDGQITGFAAFEQKGDQVTGWLDRAKTIPFPSPSFSKGTNSPSPRILSRAERWPFTVAR